MKPQIDQTIMNTAVETMEKLAFLFSFPDEARMEAFPGPAIAAKVGFNGSFSGSLALRMSSSVLAEMAVNMLGLDDAEEINQELHLDAFKEMLNVICGNLLPALSGQEAEFSIDAPQIIDDDDDTKAIEFQQAASIVRLMLEDGYCDLFLFIDGKTPEEIFSNTAEKVSII
jgi:chemotaxis protein CheY-P-specific phosphatase CheC